MKGKDSAPRAHYLKEIENLTNGVEVFCGVDGEFKRVQMGLLAYITDRPERHAILCQAQGGIFGKRTLSSAIIGNKNLPYCERCFMREVESL